MDIDNARAVGKIEELVDVVRTIIVEHAATIFAQALPVVATGISGGGPADAVDGSQKVRVDDFTNSLGFGGQAVGLVEKDPAVLGVGFFDHAVGRFERGGHRFFQDDMTSLPKGPAGHPFVEFCGGCNHDNIGRIMLPEGVEISVGFAPRNFGGFIQTFGQGIDYGNQVKVGGFNTLEEVKLPANAAQAYHGDSKFLAHRMGLFFLKS